MLNETASKTSKKRGLLLCNGSLTHSPASKEEEEEEEEEKESQVGEVESGAEGDMEEESCHCVFVCV